MAAAGASTKKPRKPDKPLYFEWQHVVLLETGERRLALVASTQWDQAACRARGFKAKQLVRAVLQRPRNPKFHALAHAMGTIAVNHCEGFEGMDAHDALKKLQRESGICCEEIEIDLGPALGKVKAQQARSIAFDSLDEAEFSALVHGICDYLTAKYHGVPPGELSEIIATIEEGRQAA
jgi:hypothetical protein